jgi:phosphatidylserine/phosphatidylglycerophosphate/cardiolipin synthase-like enzyme
MENTEVFFSPGDDCVNHIIDLINNASSHLDICVFTISDDRIARAIVEAMKNDVQIRIISDNDKLADTGSDISDLSRVGLMVKIDNTTNHMHHKFCIVDKKIVLTGSYNWTRSAALYNQENLLSTEDVSLVEKFTAEFEKLWNTYDFYES